jgi:hypothetical protein
MRVDEPGCADWVGCEQSGGEGEGSCRSLYVIFGEGDLGEILHREEVAKLILTRILSSTSLLPWYSLSNLHAEQSLFFQIMPTLFDPCSPCHLNDPRRAAACPESR